MKPALDDRFWPYGHGALRHSSVMVAGRRRVWAVRKERQRYVCLSSYVIIKRHSGCCDLKRGSRDRDDAAIRTSNNRGGVGIL